MRGKHFTLRTDHASLKYFLSQPYFSARQGRWLEDLQSFDMTIEHVPGWRNQVADALSRQTELGKTRDALREIKKQQATLGAVWKTDDALLGRMALIRGYANDQFAQGIRQRLGNTPDPLTIGSRQYKLCRGLLYSRPQLPSNSASDTGWKLYVPVGASRTRVLYAYHDSKEGGHKGFQKTYQLCARFL